jgi:GH15 family glucan-1,4-alpha-glucosidase
MHEGKGFDDFSVGLFGIEEKLGTYKDAEDGKLSQNPIEHGSVDSVIGLTIEAGAKDSNVLYYWIAAEKSIHELHTLHKEILKETPERLIESTSRYWQAWIEKESREFRTVDTRIANLYARSLAVMRVHADNRGGIIASSDTDVLNQGRDTYSYVWPRDAAIIANALDRAGHHDVTQRFFLFMKDCMEPGGYLMHKYRIDGVLGSSWHPWMQHGHPRLPIQEDETATVLYMLNQHYAYAKDIEFIETLYNPFIEKVADFLCTYTDADTGLPKESYDLWEERYGSSTYTAASVFGALMAAAELSSVLGKKENAKRYKETAEAVKKAILSYLYDPHLQMFIKLVRAENGDLFYDKTIDLSSFFSIIVFGVLDADEKIVRQAFDAMAPILKVPTSFGGYMRFDGDNYYRADRNVSPNAWCITTLWVARYYIRIAKNRNELLMAHEILKWICDRAAKSGLLPEQIHPLTGAHLSTTPLVWSHAEFVIAVDEYLKKEATL